LVNPQQAKRTGTPPTPRARRSCRHSASAAPEAKVSLATVHQARDHLLEYHDLVADKSHLGTAESMMFRPQYFTPLGRYVVDPVDIRKTCRQLAQERFLTRL
jgi:hypothetical protein